MFSRFGVHASRFRQTPCIYALLPTAIRDIITENTPQNDDRKSGWEGIQRVFSMDDEKELSPELVFVFNTCWTSFFAGVVYGGFIRSKEAYQKFINENVATAFESHLDAKRKIQHEVTMSFAKGAFQWGWRLAAFSGLYMGSAVIISAYRGEIKMYDYGLAGLFAGTIFRLHIGLPAALIGGLLGGILGLLGGALVWSCLNALGISINDVYYWLANKYVERQKIQREHYSQKERKEHPLIAAHHYLTETKASDVNSKNETNTTKSGN